MSNFDEIVLKADGGDIVAYLAPNFSVEPVLKNAPINFARPRGQGPLVKDLGKVNLEIVIQGIFQDSTQLPQDHREALEILFGVAPGTLITSTMQVNLLWAYAYAGGRFRLYEGDNSWSKDLKSSVDIANGDYPSVTFAEVRRNAPAGVTKRSYTIRMIPGLKR